jgi:diphthine methyl ester acylhydrolase
MASIKSIFSCNISLPPSCIEFVPNQQEFLLIGTYLLSESIPSENETQRQDQSTGPGHKQERHGSVMLMKLQSDVLQEVETHLVGHGVLDLHFSPHRDNVFCTANSTSSITVYSFSQDDGSDARIKEICTIKPVEEECLVLAVAWNANNPSMLGATLSSGHIIILTGMDGLPQSEPDIIVSSISIHNLEAWTVSFSPDPHTLFSGGDDSVIRAEKIIHDPMFDPSQDIRSETIWKNSKIHTAGVTAILPLSESYIVTGSYDDHIRLLEISTASSGVKRPNLIVEENLGGGVWRLKLLRGVPAGWQDKKKDVEFLILASCMHTGARILRLFSDNSLANWRIEVLAKFEEHKSMNYGSDALLIGDDITVVSTSFYDKLVCLWSFRVEAQTLQSR